MRFAKIMAIALLLLTAGCGKKHTHFAGNDAGYEYTVNELAPGIANTVYFNTDSSTITKESEAVLMEQAKWLKQRGGRTLIIEGHCDERGTRGYNLALGERRANAVKKFLSSNGIDPDKITVVSYGKDRPDPSCSRKTHGEPGYEEYLARNRRSVSVPR